MLEHELEQCRADAALVVHALDCAMQLTEALISFLPSGTPLHPAVATAKHNFDRAWAAVQGKQGQAR